MRDRVRANLLAGIARARLWREEIVEGRGASAGEIASREGLSERSVRMTLSLAFLSPAIIRSIMEGALPRGVGVSSLSELPASWAKQHQALGLTSSP
jgi:hypothetical protein